jgi:hypothetical protein
MDTRDQQVYRGHVETGPTAALRECGERLMAAQEALQDAHAALQVVREFAISFRDEGGECNHDAAVAQVRLMEAAIRRIEAVVVDLPPEG